MVWFVCQAFVKRSVDGGDRVTVSYQGVELRSERENGAFGCTCTSEGKSSHVITYRVSCLSITSLSSSALLHPHPNCMDSAYQLQPVHSHWNPVKYNSKEKCTPISSHLVPQCLRIILLHPPLWRIITRQPTRRVPPPIPFLNHLPYKLLVTAIWLPPLLRPLCRPYQIRCFLFCRRLPSTV